MTRSVGNLPLGVGLRRTRRFASTNSICILLFLTIVLGILDAIRYNFVSNTDDRLIGKPPIAKPICTIALHLFHRDLFVRCAKRAYGKISSDPRP